MQAQRKLGLEVISGGGGGNFFRTALRRWRPDILHFHWLHPYLLRGSATSTFLRGLRFLAEVRILRSTGQRIVWTAHNLGNHEQRQARLELFFRRRFATLCDAIICHSEAAKHEVFSRLGVEDERKIVVIPHGHYIGAYRNCISRECARAELALQPRQFVFLFLGQIRPYKGVTDLIEAFRKIESSNIRLIIAGKPGDATIMQFLQEQTAGDTRIRLIPAFVLDDDIQIYMRAADVVVLPYRHVLTSGAAVLAMSFGKPCIAPAMGGLPEVIGNSGFLYGTKQLPTLHAALKAALAISSELPEVGQRAFDQANEWSWDKISQALNRCYFDKRTLAELHESGKQAAHYNAKSNMEVERRPASYDTEADE